MIQPGRQFSLGSSYRYGFNGKENDNEVKREGNQQDYGMRIYDPRLGKFLSVDPLTKDYPWYSPYHFAGNDPIRNIDLDGGEPKSRVEQWKYNKTTTSVYDDPQLGIIGVESVFDKATNQNWFIHQGNDGQMWYWQHKEGTEDPSVMIQSKNSERSNGSWQQFQTTNHIEAQKVLKDRSFDYMMAGGMVALPAMAAALPAAAAATPSIVSTATTYGTQAVTSSLSSRVLASATNAIFQYLQNAPEHGWGSTNLKNINLSAVGLSALNPSSVGVSAIAGNFGKVTVADKFSQVIGGSKFNFKAAAIGSAIDYSGGKLGGFLGGFIGKNAGLNEHSSNFAGNALTNTLSAPSNIIANEATKEKSQ